MEEVDFPRISLNKCLFVHDLYLSLQSVGLLLNKWPNPTQKLILNYNMLLRVQTKTAWRYCRGIVLFIEFKNMLFSNNWTRARPILLQEKSIFHLYLVMVAKSCASLCLCGRKIITFFFKSQTTVSAYHKVRLKNKTIWHKPQMENHYWQLFPVICVYKNIFLQLRPLFFYSFFFFLRLSFYTVFDFSLALFVF